VGGAILGFGDVEERGKARCGVWQGLYCCGLEGGSALGRIEGG